MIILRIMQAALFVLRLFPPPPAGADALPRFDRPRARGAPDRGITPVMERVVWHVVAADVIPNLRIRPVRKRIDLDKAVGLDRKSVV